jgi:PIN domain nuclease of toxin-antitoxin system
VSLLLDTNVLIWLAHDPKRVPVAVRNALEFGKTDKCVSVVSAWEYGQKRKSKPLELPFSFESLIAKIPAVYLDFEFELYRYAESLPLIHRDPFDRMLIAQALHHDLTFVTSETDIHKYPIKTLW